VAGSVQSQVPYGVSTGLNFVNKGTTDPQAQQNAAMIANNKLLAQTLNDGLKNIRPDIREVRVFIGDTELTGLIRRVQVERETTVSRQLTFGRGV
jgi:hypothetical protein